MRPVGRCRFSTLWLLHLLLCKFITNFTYDLLSEHGLPGLPGIIRSHILLLGLFRLLEKL